MLSMLMFFKTWREKQKASLNFDEDNEDSDDTNENVVKRTAIIPLLWAGLAVSAEMERHIYAKPTVLPRDIIPDFLNELPEDRFEARFRFKNKIFVACVDSSRFPTNVKSHGTPVALE